MEIEAIIEAAEKGDIRSIGRICTIIEGGGDDGVVLAGLLYRRGGDGWTTGITGVPGAGKSTLVAELAERASVGDSRVAILAVDPTSPLTGGAILGDRVRMGQHSGNANIFIRSLANRGHLGGISTATPAMAAALEGLGYGEIMIETVGVGQSEVEIASVADTSVVVVTAGWGDSVQAAKAGFLEIADVFVVNKADREGADAAANDINAMLDVGPSTPWRPPVLQTVALEAQGVGEVWEAIQAHRSFLVSSGELATRRRLRAAHDLTMALQAGVDGSIDRDELVSEVLDDIVARTADPWSAAARFLRSL